MGSFNLKFEEANRFVEEMLRKNSTGYLQLKFQVAMRYFAEAFCLTAHEFECLKSDVDEGAFLLAGTARGGQLTKLQLAMKDALFGSPQRTLREFSKVLRQIAEDNGRATVGLDADGWRTRIIYDTNLTVAYQAGRWQELIQGQFQFLQYHFPAWSPFLRVEHEYDGEPLKDDDDDEEDEAVNETRRGCCDAHRYWDGLILRADDPWWDTHYPPNGWGCQCRVSGVSAGLFRTLGKPEPESPSNNVVDKWLDKATGSAIEVPKGIDPGWDYNIGKIWLGVQR
jgi:hypothetical protein